MFGARISLRLSSRACRTESSLSSAGPPRTSPEGQERTGGESDYWLYANAREVPVEGYSLMRLKDLEATGGMRCVEITDLARY